MSNETTKRIETAVETNVARPIGSSHSKEIGTAVDTGFVRQRTHHHWAAAVRFERDEWGYVWQPESNFPVAPQRFRNPKGERLYTERFVGRLVRDALTHLEERAAKLLPDDA